MKEKDVIFHYDYNEQNKIFNGKVILLNRIEEKYNQEFWEVKNLRNGKKYKIWIGKPTEWYRPEKLLPEKSDSLNSIDVLVIGYNRETHYLKYKISHYDYKNDRWDGNVDDMEKILYWKYLENSPISLTKNFNKIKN